MAVKITYDHTFGGLSGTVPLSFLDDNYGDVGTALASANTYSNYLVDTGSTNAYTASMSAGLSATETDGLILQVLAANPNTGASTFKLGINTAKSIVNIGGAPLVAGQILGNGIMQLLFSAGSYQLLNPAGVTGTSTASAFIPTGATIPSNGLYLPAANNPAIAANGTEAISFLSTGVSVPGTLGVTGVSTLHVVNATSINFGGTTITNYVEGTYTPQYVVNGSATGITYTSQIGRYRQLNKKADFSATVTISSKGANSGALSISLPFQAATVSGHQWAGGLSVNGMGSSNPPLLLIQSAATAANLTWLVTGSSANINNSDGSSGSTYIAGAHYDTI